MMGLRIEPGMMLRRGTGGEDYRVLEAPGDGFMRIANGVAVLNAGERWRRNTGVVPDLEDRATFLLALDQLAERVGLEGLTFSWGYWDATKTQPEPSWTVCGDWHSIDGEEAFLSFFVDAGPNEPIKALRLALEQTAP